MHIDCHTDVLLFEYNLDSRYSPEYCPCYIDNLNI